MIFFISNIRVKIQFKKLKQSCLTATLHITKLPPMYYARKVDGTYFKTLFYGNRVVSVVSPGMQRGWKDKGLNNKRKTNLFCSYQIPGGQIEHP